MKLAQSIVLANTQGDLIAEGLVTLVVGMSVVFLALLALVVLLELSGSFFANSKKKDDAKKLSASLVKPVIVEPVTAEPITAEIDDSELVAVITAAIAASMGTTADNFQVRSLRKTNNVWGAAGRKEQLYN